jgi:hypothetical protein
VERFAVYFASSTFAVLGAVMLTQWVYDRASVSGSFVAFAALLLIAGIGGGALTVKR